MIARACSILKDSILTTGDHTMATNQPKSAKATFQEVVQLCNTSFFIL
jgi:hypothetical protein